MPESDRHWILVAWNDTAVAEPAPSVPDLVARQAALRPHAIAVTDDAGSYTYAELDAPANRLAHPLPAPGTGPEDLVAVCPPRPAAMVAALPGGLPAGAAYVPPDPAD